MRLIDLALKDLLQVMRDRNSAFFLLAMPILFTFFFGWMFSNVGGEEDPRLPVGLVMQDQSGVLSEGFSALLEMSDVIRPVPLDGEETEKAAAAVADKELVAAVIVPANYGDRAWAGEPFGLTLIADPASQAGQTATRAIEAAVLRLLGAVQAARISADTAGITGEARPAYLDEGLALALDGWRQPPLAVIAEPAGDAAGDDQLWDAYGQASPGMMVMFGMFGMVQSAMVLVLERRSGALQRLLTTPIRVAELIGGHVLAMFAITFAQLVLLVVVGQLAFDVGYMREPLATLAMVVTVALWVASLGLLVSTISRTEDQAITYSLVSMMLLSALGGAWFPLDITGEVFSTIGHLTPTAWAMDGFQNIVMRGMGLSSVLLPAGILLAYAVAFFGVAVWRFKFE